MKDNTGNENDQENVGNEGDGNEEEEIPEEKPDIYSFTTEQEIKDVIGLMYTSLAEYLKKQIAVESLYLKTGGHESVTPVNSEIESMWQHGYETLYKANKCLVSLEQADFINDDSKTKYVFHCRAIRGFVTKQMTEHWGRIPLAAEGFKLSDMLPNAMEDELIQFCREDFDYAIELYSPDTDFCEDAYLSSQALMVAQAEISLFTADLSRGVDMCRRCLETAEKDVFFELKSPSAEISICTRTHAELLLAELSILTDIVNENESNAEWNEDIFGYWYMLKRTGRLMEISQCPEYKLLLPIPSSELNRNFMLMQNPGY